MIRVKELLSDNYFSDIKIHTSMSKKLKMFDIKIPTSLCQFYFRSMLFCKGPLVFVNIVCMVSVTHSNP